MSDFRKHNKRNKKERKAKNGIFVLLVTYEKLEYCLINMLISTAFDCVKLSK